MKCKLLFICLAAVSLTVGFTVQGAEKAKGPEKKTVLFDGRSFDGLFRYLRRGRGDVDETWTIKENGVLACKGRPAGYIRTKKAYKNYHLHVEYRWSGRPGNNGVLVHMTGRDRVWPKSLECQGMYRNQGDFFEIGGVEFNEHKVKGHRVRGRRVLKAGPHNEKKPGEWNDYDVWCIEDTVRVYVNGTLMNEATGCSVTEGMICLQSEGVPIEYRNFYIEPGQRKPWPVTPKKKTVLFNGRNLNGWIRFIPNDKRDEKGKWMVDRVWSVRDGIIKCKGRPNGYIRTVERYADYKLHLEWRWSGKPTNSGVLLHKKGIDRVWPTCIEAQLMHENAGDFWLLTFSKIVVKGKTIGPKRFANGKKWLPESEKPAGEWNEYDIICDKDTVELRVNGTLQNRGEKAVPSSGPICLQSEGSPIEFRNIYLEPLDK